MQVPKIGLGCFPLSLKAVDDNTAIDIISSAYDMGYRLFNTAITYGAGRSEELIGRALSGKRKEVIIVSKGGYTENYEHCGKPEKIIESCHASLKRLKTDYIDVYELHSPDPAIPIEETMQAFVRLKEEGKIRYVGISQCLFEEIKRANKIVNLLTIELEYSLRVRWVEDKIIPWCEEHNKYLLAYVPLGRGYLTDNLKPETNELEPYNEQYQKKKLKETINGMKKLIPIAKKIGCTLAQLSLAYLVNRNKIVIPIPGATKVWQVKDNFEALNIHLNESTLDAINRVFIS